MEIGDFLEIEKKYDLYSETIGGVYYWNYCRSEIWSIYILKSILGLGVAHNQKRGLINLKNCFKVLFNAVTFKFTRIQQNNVCIINHPRRVLCEDTYECVYTSKLAFNINDCIMLEKPYQYKHMRHDKSENVKYLDVLFVNEALYYVGYRLLFRNRYGNLLGQIVERIEKPLRELESTYGLTMDRKAITAHIAKRILYYKASIGLVRRIIEKINPKVFVEVVSYSFDCMMFTEVCKEKGIPVIELQHGILTNNIAYNYNTDKEIGQIPDKIFLFSDYWKSHINWPVAKENLVTTGFPYFERKLSEATKVEEYDDGKQNIIFISQGTIGHKLSRVAIELSKILDQKQYRIFYKLHPGEFAVWRERYDGLADADIIVLDDHKNFLYDYFATCQVQVGVYSTALYEGLGFGLKTFIYKIEMSEQMGKLAEAGYVDCFADADELKEKLELGKAHLQAESEQFWCENALDNILQNIENVIAER